MSGSIAGTTCPLHRRRLNYAKSPAALPTSSSIGAGAAAASPKK
eukprot:CAMPEP_0194734948 /NCGR_PEP_ID=MMETSP0296-20130528/71700_1 /TAXON_ID=39354 /ORGANISM="Heterosigma akashiwo, Strain CCMP2393" /LENGTH=43 /DNA_ID= /DNA_START= /DNA_END= /DNA_ORIENTATION=